MKTTPDIKEILWSADSWLCVEGGWQKEKQKLIHIVYLAVDVRRSGKMHNALKIERIAHAVLLLTYDTINKMF